MSDKPRTHGWDHRPGGFDPTPPGYWHYVQSSTVGLPSAWSGATNYVSTNTVSHGVHTYICILANTNVEPGVNSHWYNYWQIYQPIFQNGWANTSTSLQSMRFRIAVGPPHYLDKDSGSITSYADHQLEIQGSVSGGNPNTIIFYLPPAYWPKTTLRLAASDDVGGFTVMQVRSTDGAVSKGII